MIAELLQGERRIATQAFEQSGRGGFGKPIQSRQVQHGAAKSARCRIVLYQFEEPTQGYIFRHRWSGGGRMPGSGVDGKMRQDDGGGKKAEEFTSLVHVRSGTPMMVPIGLTP